MNTILKIALFGGGAYLLLSKLGFSLPALSGEPAPVDPPVTPGAATSPTPITPIMLLVKSKALHDYPQGKGLLDFWQWAYYYNDVIGVPSALPGPEQYGVVGSARITFDQFWAIVSNAALTQGVATDLPGILSGLRRVC